MEIIPGTVCCILCRGLVIFKNGDKSRFKAHLNNEHGAFFDIDYLLASSLMEADQKAEVAKTVNVIERDMETSDRESTYGEDSSFQEATNEKSQFLCGSCSTHFAAKTSYIQHIAKGCKKEALKTGYSCTSCDKSYSSKGNLNVHVVKHHGQDNIKQENVDHAETQAENYQRYYQDKENGGTSFSTEAYGAGQGFGGNMGQEDMQYSQDDNLSSAGTSFEEENENATNLNDQISNVDSEMSFKKHLPCGVCKKIFGSSQSLAKHVIKKHNSQGITNSSFNESVDGPSGLNGSKPQKEFVCAFQPCTKSFSNKQTLNIHERKTHDRPPMKKGRRSKKDAFNQSSNLDNSSLNESYPRESYLSTDYPSTFPSEFSDPSAVSAGINNFQNFDVAETNTTLDEGETIAPVENNLSSSFLTDTSLDFDDAPIPEEDNMSQCDSQADSMVDLADFDDKNEEPFDQNSTENPRLTVDLSKSKYFIKNPNVIANARGKSVKLFDEEAKDLPEGWKMRSIEVKLKTGGMSSIKHFLTPDTKVLKTGLAVIEYLRLEGILSTDKILEISNKLNVSEKKLRNLYKSE